MLKHLRFSFFPIKVSYTESPFRASVRPTNHVGQPKIYGEMREGLIRAYAVIANHHNNNTGHFHKEDFVSPRLGYAMDTLRENVPFVPGEVLHVSLVRRSFVDGYTEEQYKIGGIYSREEVIEQLIAGFCGPESPMWHYVPQKEVIDILYTTTLRRDVFQFERDFDKDGDWVLSNINGVIAKPTQY